MEYGLQTATMKPTISLNANRVNKTDSLEFRVATVSVCIVTRARRGGAWRCPTGIGDNGTQWN